MDTKRIGMLGESCRLRRSHTMSLRVISAEHAASTRKLIPVAGSITMVVPSDSDNEVPKSGTWLG